MKISTIIPCAFLIIILFASLSFAEKELPVFDFATTEAARAAWTPAKGVARVGLFDGFPPLEKQGVRFPCNFSSVDSRCYWDMNTSEDLTSYTLIKLRIHVSNPNPITSFTLYFRSGSGWYSATFSGLQKGWQVLSRSRADFNFSGTPTGWHAINGIRISPWKGLNVDTEIIANSLLLMNAKTFLVKGTKSTSAGTAESTNALIASCLDAVGIEHTQITEEDVESGGLKNSKLAIFPYSNNMSAEEIAQIQNYVASGGKIIVFYTAPQAVFTLLGLQNKGISGIAAKAMRFRTDIVECIPPYIQQASWNFFNVQPVASDVQVLANWEDAEGTQTLGAAWTSGNNGAYMSHILLSDDLENKKKLMSALVSYFVPETKWDIVTRAFEGIGRIGEYSNYDEAVLGIRKSGSTTPRAFLVEKNITASIFYRNEVLDSLTSGTYCQNLDLITSSRLHLLEAYYLAQKSLTPEFRAVWASYNHSSGPYVDGWDKMAIDLAQNRFNAVMPYMATGGVAHYNSQFLPHSDIYNQRGDHIAACVKACKPRGIETHVRKLSWFLYFAPQSFIDDMRNQKRTQVDVNGNPVDWLCPSHPLNYELEINVMLEIIDNYDVDGIHYDYIRYPDETCCYCEGCLERFQKDTGNTVVNWPLDCYSGPLKEAYREWRREQITRVVRGMRQAVAQRDKKVQISAAVFSGYPSCKSSVAHDWVSWIENGYLDFVCPMDYTDSGARLENLLESQLNYTAGKAPLYPGISISSEEKSLSADKIIELILVTRKYRTNGFIILVYNTTLSEKILPNLRKGIISDPEKTGMILH